MQFMLNLCNIYHHVEVEQEGRGLEGLKFKGKCPVARLGEWNSPGRKSLLKKSKKYKLAQANQPRLGEDVPWTRRFIKVGTDLALLGEEMSAPSCQQL